MIDVFAQVVKQNTGSEHRERDVDRRDEAFVDNVDTPGARDCGADDPHHKQEGFEIRFDLLVQEWTDQHDQENERKCNRKHGVLRC